MKFLKSKKTGFTIIEMTIVLIVISLILAGVLKTVGIQRQQLKRDEARQQLQNIKEALIGFALTRGRLPCPDTGVDGIENPPDPANGDDCDTDGGWLPHVDIGLGNLDTWGNRFRYRVRGSGVNSFADEAPSLSGTPVASSASFSVDAAATGNIRVADENDLSIATNVPAIVVSFGANGRGQAACGAGLSAKETENCDNDVEFVDSFYSDVAGQTYDDLLIWIPVNVLKARMIEAGRLP